MNTIGSLLEAALGRPVQSPAVFVEVALVTTRRWSSFADADWNGATWAARDMEVRDLEVQAYTLSGTLILGNADNVAGALQLNEGFKDRSIRIWGYDASAPSDVVWFCDAVGGGVRVGPNEVVITLRHPCDGLTSPRAVVSDATFGSCLPDGAVIRINGQDLRLERSNS